MIEWVGGWEGVWLAQLEGMLDFSLLLTTVVCLFSINVSFFLLHRWSCSGHITQPPLIILDIILVQLLVELLEALKGMLDVSLFLTTFVCLFVLFLLNSHLPSPLPVGEKVYTLCWSCCCRRKAFSDRANIWLFLLHVCLFFYSLSLCFVVICF